MAKAEVQAEQEETPEAMARMADPVVRLEATTAAKERPVAPSPAQTAEREAHQEVQAAQGEELVAPAAHTEAMEAPEVVLGTKVGTAATAKVVGARVASAAAVMATILAAAAESLVALSAEYTVTEV